MNKNNLAVFPQSVKPEESSKDPADAYFHEKEVSRSKMTKFLTKGKPITTKVDEARALSYMNAMLAVVREQGKTHVLVEGFDPVLKRRTIHRSTFQDVATFYHRKIQAGVYQTSGEPKYASVGQWWLAHEKRRQYRGVVFAPGKEVPEYFNLWNGFSVEPKEGDWSLFLEHIYEVICSEDTDLYLYLFAWMAQGVQQPAVKPEVAIVLRSSERGTGKSTFTRYYRQLFGEHGVEVSNPEHLVGRFNGHLEACCVLVLTEAFFSGPRGSEAVLKALITEDTIAIERKGVDVRNSPSYLRILMTSNSDQVVPAGLDERRFLVLDVDPKHKQDTAYFGAIVEQMNNGGLAAMLYDLMDFDYSVIDLRTAPQTPALLNQKIQNLDAKDRWLFDKLVEGRLLPKANDWPLRVQKDLLFEDFTEVSKSFRFSRPVSRTEFGIYLKKVFGPGLQETRPNLGKRRVRYWKFPPLQRCQEIFDQRLGASYDWPKDGTKQVKGKVKVKGKGLASTSPNDFEDRPEEP